MVARVAQSLLVAVALAGAADALEPAVLVRDILPGGSSGPTELTRVGDRVYFTAVGDDGTIGRELWVTDGSESGTKLLRDVNQEPFRDSLIHDLTAFGGALYFGAGSPFRIGPSGLWRSDGTPNGTRSVSQTLPSAGGLSASPQRLFFVAATMFSADACWLDRDQQVGCAGKGFRLEGGPFAVAGDRFFFVAAPTFDSADFELWTSDGTADGTHVVRDILPGDRGAGALYVAALHSTLYFVASDGTPGGRLWSSDGSEAGTHPLSAAPPAATGLRATADRLFFVAPADTDGYALWVSDGTDAGTTSVRRFAPQRDDGPSVFPMGTLGDRVLLLANGAKDLWISDGTASGTRRLRTFQPGETGAAPYGFIDIGGRTVFTACAAQGCEPWITDGTTAGTRQLADVWPGDPSSYPTEYTRLGRQLLFRASSDLGDELWKIDLDICAGDCDRDGRTTIAELTLGVSVTLGSRPLSACAALDDDGDGRPSIADLVGAVAAALNGCVG